MSVLGIPTERTLMERPICGALRCARGSLMRRLPGTT
jgi:hypothetical protein